VTDWSRQSLSWRIPGEGANTRGVLFVSTANGPPTGWPFMLRQIDGALWCTTYRSSAKMPQIRHADRAVAVLFEHENDPAPFSVVEGRVEVVEPTNELVSRWIGLSAAAVVEGRGGRVADRLLRGKRVFLRLVPDHNEEVVT
jgi:hypothetical protein